MSLLLGIITSESGRKQRLAYTVHEDGAAYSVLSPAGDVCFSGVGRKSMLEAITYAIAATRGYADGRRVQRLEDRKKSTGARRRKVGSQ